jgi:hypothetical protein
MIHEQGGWVLESMPGPSPIRPVLARSTTFCAEQAPGAAPANTKGHAKQVILSVSKAMAKFSPAKKKLSCEAFPLASSTCT